MLYVYELAELDNERELSLLFSLFADDPSWFMEIVLSDVNLLIGTAINAIMSGNGGCLSEQLHNLEALEVVATRTSGDDINMAIMALIQLYSNVIDYFSNTPKFGNLKYRLHQTLVSRPSFNRTVSVFILAEPIPHRSIDRSFVEPIRDLIHALFKGFDYE